MAREIYRGRIIDLRLEDVRLPNGTVVELEIMHHPGASAVAAVDETERVTLIRQYRHAAGGWLWELPAGVLDPGEEPATCAARELREETGLTAEDIRPLGAIVTTPGFCDERIHLFLARGLQESAHAQGADEVIAEIRRVPVRDALGMVRRGEIVDGKTIAGLYLAAAALGVAPVKVGLTGFSGAGKTTVFNALTGLSAPTAGGGDGRPNLGVIKVPDARVDKLTEIHQPKKTTYAEVSFIDFPPPRSASQKRAVLDADTVAQLRDADALVEVVRGFPDLAGEAPTPIADLDAFSAELLLADLAVLEKRLERVKKEKGHERERPLLERCVAALGDGTPLRKLELSADERATLAGFALLTLRPLLIVLNVGEGDAAAAVPADVAARAADESANALVLSAKVEAELTALEPADRAAFLADLGLQASARDRFIRASYALLDLISFLTAGDDECRAWPIRRGTSALKAAGRIHSDIERGFIRAEVVSFDDFVALGSEAKCRAAGKLRLEGKEYVVQDGDIAHFRFAV